jgi:hypothetical protein
MKMVVPLGGWLRHELSMYCLLMKSGRLWVVFSVEGVFQFEAPGIPQPRGPGNQ